MASTFATTGWPICATSSRSCCRSRSCSRPRSRRTSLTPTRGRPLRRGRSREGCQRDVISALPDGYDTMVGERGTIGRRARVALARAFSRMPQSSSSMNRRARLTSRRRMRSWTPWSGSCGYELHDRAPAHDARRLRRPRGARGPPDRRGQVRPPPLYQAGKPWSPTPPDHRVVLSCDGAHLGTPGQAAT